LSSTARAVVYLPIDGLIASLDDALAEIREIESRSSGDGIDRDTFAYRPPLPATLEQRQRLRDAKEFIELAQALVYEYAKGPTA
jgi:hypothetical protein